MVGIAPLNPPYVCLDIHLGFQRELFNEFPAGFDDVAHQFGEHFVGFFHMVDLDLEEGAGVGVERGFPELVGVHFAEALVALDLDAVAAGAEGAV